MNYQASLFFALAFYFVASTHHVLKGDLNALVWLTLSAVFAWLSCYLMSMYDEFDHMNVPVAVENTVWWASAVATGLAVLSGVNSFFQ